MSVSAGNDLSCMYHINGSVNGIVTLSSQGGFPLEWLCNQNVTVKAYLEKTPYMVLAYKDLTIH